MKLVLSRKGFDSAAGGAPSPIVEGRPISLPIPATRNSSTTYDDLGLGSYVTRATRGRIDGAHLCHHDPMFVHGECIFGQCDAAQSHLANQGVGVGDTFLFFGLFADEKTGERHHRIFGYLRVAERHVVQAMDEAVRDELARLCHPHVLGIRTANNTVYRGEGATAAHSADALRLTRAGGPLSHWAVPAWLRGRGLTYHSKPSRWIGEDGLYSVARGQEFVCDIGDDSVAHAWVDDIIRVIRT
ncbi:hypothetical protein [Sphingosinicella sp. YJ22]|uniref:Nmad3 family putative nucleotide modification protein n=1 Tax=Sphingosinicella sp. YJ22 TaxID=1104780 RepID=UPI001408B876|nr:hypothetical protein [Sphingosinicella sp. YJ22]